MTDPTSDLVARTRALRPLIESDAARAEADTTTTSEWSTRSPRPSCSGCWCRRSWAAPKPRSTTCSRCSRSWPTPTARPAGRRWRTSPRRASRRSTPATTPSAAMFPAGALGIHAGMLGPVGTARADRRRLRRLGPLPVRQRLRARHVVRRRACRRSTSDGERADRRRRPARDARRVPAPGAGRVARQLGRARPRGHRQLRLRGRRAVRRGRLLVPAARGRGPPRRRRLRHRAVRPRRGRPRRLRARRRQARARRGPRARPTKERDGRPDRSRPSSSSSTTSRCTTPRCAPRAAYVLESFADAEATALARR